MEFYFEEENGDWNDLNNVLDKHLLSNSETLSSNKLLNHLKKRFKKKYDESSDNENNFQEEDIDEEMNKSMKMLCELLNQPNEESLLSKFPLYGISSAFKKFQTHEPLLSYEETAIINFVNRFTTCTLNASSIEEMTRDPILKEKSAEVVDIVRCVNKHHHTKSCRKYETICRFGFAKFPIWKTLISKPSQLPKSEKEEMLVIYKKILSKVKSILDDNEIIQGILAEYPNKEEESRDVYVKNREIRIKKVLSLAGLKTDEFDLYVHALETSSGGYTIMLERDIDEINVNSYNPEWARAWNGNTDLQVCLDYFAVITYITNYYTKDDSGTMTFLLQALKEADCESLKEKMITLMNTFIAARQMGETEAFYKIFPDFHLKDSNVRCVFVPVSKRKI